MELQEIEIKITRSGKTQLHVRGAKGHQCLEITQGLIELLGADVISQTLTPEHQESIQQTQPLQNEIQQFQKR